MGRKVEVDEEKIKARVVEASNKEIERKNKNRNLKVEYSKGDLVFVRNENRRSKLDTYFNGPFEITGVRLDKNWIQVDLGNKTEWINIKRAKRYAGKREQDDMNK